jgi:hypothetical protein
VVEVMGIKNSRQRGMSNKVDSQIDSDQPTIYQIRIKGHLGQQWAEWFGGLTITLEENGETLMTGLVIDQADLHGLLRKVRDIGMPLLSVTCVTSGPTDAQE